MTFSISRAMIFRRVKSRFLKTVAKIRFGEKVLNEHLLYGSNGEVRINRGLALPMKTGERLLKVWVVLAFRLD